MTGRKLEERSARRRAQRLGAHLHEQRIAAELSQEELARRAHLATATIRKIESRDPPEPRFFTVLDMAEVLGIGSRQFLGLIRDLQRRSDL